MLARPHFLATASAFALSASLGATPALAGDTAAASLPAVSATNGSLSGFVGDLGEGFSAGGIASLTLPLEHLVGLQIDGDLGTARGNLFGGGSAHLFWRDPAQGLLGVYASYQRWDWMAAEPASNPTFGLADRHGAQIGKSGLEGELYLNKFTLRGLGTYQFGIAHGASGRASLSYYPTPDIRLDLASSYARGSGHLEAAGGEWSPSPRLPLTLFAQAGVTGHGDARVLGGIRITFAKTAKPLIRRDREDAIDPILPDNLFETIGDGYCPVGTVLINGFCDGNG